MAKIGKNIPIPFSETEVSPDKVSDKYINNPNKKRFIKIIIRPITNCNFLFLNKNIAISERIADVMNIKGINFKVITSFKNKSTTKISCLIVFHKLNIKIKPPDTMVAKNKYIV